jgi:hypothetical protein
VLASVVVGAAMAASKYDQHRTVPTPVRRKWEMAGWFVGNQEVRRDEG